MEFTFAGLRDRCQETRRRRLKAGMHSEVGMISLRLKHRFKIRQRAVYLYRDTMQLFSHSHISTRSTTSREIRPKCHACPLNKLQNNRTLMYTRPCPQSASTIHPAPSFPKCYAAILILTSSASSLPSTAPSTNLLNPFPSSLNSLSKPGLGSSNVLPILP